MGVNIDRLIDRKYRHSITLLLAFNTQRQPANARAASDRSVLPDYFQSPI
jgi:hypothetical protein